MSRQLGSLHRSNSHPTNLTSPIPIIPLFAFPPPDFSPSNVTSGMNSDTNSHISVLYSISQLNNPNIETPDEFADSEPSPSNNFHNSSNFSQPPFQPILSNNPDPLTDTQAYESFKERFQIFSLTFHFLAPHERDLHCSHDIMLRTKQTHTYSYYRFIQNHFDLHTPSRQPHHRFQFINSKYTSPFFLNFTYCIKDTNLHGILRNYDPITQMYIFCPITKTFNAEESRPFLIPHEFVQPIEIPILEFIHNTKFNHKLYNLIQNTPYEFAVGTEELTTIKALQLLWPLLQTKNIIRILAKLLTTSELIHDIFPHGFFPDD